MEFKHPYLPITKEIESEMLNSLGKKSLEDLFGNIPNDYRLKRDLDIPTSKTELEVAQRVQELASKNKPADTGRVFLGAGAGIHYIPSVVPALATRSEFLTSYTSYQPEISQGMLQTLFEYQSMMAELLGIDVVNSSMYDMATGLAEAVLMAARVNKKRSRFLVPDTINPVHLQVINTFAEPAGITIERIGHDRKSMLLDLADLRSKLDNQVAGVYVENPSYLGFIESQVDEINHIVHDAGSLLVAGVDVLSLGILRPPGNYGADIVVGEGQYLGSAVSYGGPYLGVFGCRDSMNLIRQLPGRLVGMTRTSNEPYERGFVLTLVPREQHIRREKATSNICSNQALIAVTAAVYTSTLGPEGFRHLGEVIAHKSHYAAKQLTKISGVTAPAFDTSFWKEFVVRFDGNASAQMIHESLLKRDLHGGKILTEEYPEFGESMLLCVTELHSKTAIDALVEVVRDVVTKGGGTG